MTPTKSLNKIINRKGKAEKKRSAEKGGGRERKRKEKERGEREEGIEGVRDGQTDRQSDKGR